MWLLSCSGHLFAGQRKWLAPGTTNLLGRTSSHPESGEHINYIDHKSVSRKHLVIKVAEAQPQDSSKLHKRTEVTLTDNSKVGTSLDGQKFMKEERRLDGKAHTIKLGSYEHTFKLEWVPVTLTCLWLSKKGRGGDALAEAKQQLDGTDIKLVTEYVSNETTHALAKTRNAVQALQALIQGKWLITPEWLDQLAKAARRGVTGANGEWQPGPLEADFDGCWPKEEDFIVPTGKEPVPRPESFLKPNVNRVEIFHDFIFVFLTQHQYDTLLPVVTTGGGKAMLWEYKPEGDVADLVSYVRKLAGRKYDSQYRLSQWDGSGGTVVVRFVDPDHEQKEFLRKMDLALRQRSINQNEFLDPVLTVDASGLRQPLPDEEEGDEQPAGDVVEQQPSPPRSQWRENEQMEDVQEQRAVNGSPRQSAAEEEAPVEEQGAEEPVEQPAAKKPKWNRRYLTKSRFQGFDDFDTSQFSKNVAASPSPEPEPSQAESIQSMDLDDEPSQAATQARKRPAQVSEEEEEGIESMLHGQAALKRRKTEAARCGEKHLFAKSFSEDDRLMTERAEAKRKRKSEKLPDVKAALQAKKEAEEERRRKEEEALREQLEVVDLSEVRNLIQVEEIELRTREARASRAASRGERWDPAWNGRQNFKKFRPQGQRQDGPRLQRIIVQLEEVPRKGHGSGDEYWLTRDIGRNNPRTKSNSQSQSRTVRAGPTGDSNGDQDHHARFRRRVQRSREEDAEDTSNQVDPDEIAGGVRAARDTGLQDLAKQSQTFGTDSQRKAAGKRPAADQGIGPAAKKPKQTQSRALARRLVDDDDDEDELRFRRRR